MSFGFSVYFGLNNTREENIDLLREAYRLGFKRIFTSLHIPYKVILKLLNEVYTARTDEARDAIRASESRIILKNNIIEPYNTINKEYGDITIDNKDYYRYMGELQILLTNQEKDNRTNVVGSILQKDIYLLKYIQGGRKFKFNYENKRIGGKG